MLIIKNKLLSNNYELNQLGISINIMVCIITLIFSVCIPMISSLIAGRKVSKKSPIVLNKER